MRFHSLAERQAEFKARVLAGKVRGVKRAPSHSKRCVVCGSLKANKPSRPNAYSCRACTNEHRRLAKARQVAARESKAFARISQYLNSQKKVVEIRSKVKVYNPQSMLRDAA